MLVYDNESNEKRKDCVSSSFSFFSFIFVVCEQFSVEGGVVS
jgi:hypothetical protein